MHITMLMSSVTFIFVLGGTFNLKRNAEIVKVISSFGIVLGRSVLGLKPTVIDFGPKQI